MFVCGAAVVKSQDIFKIREIKTLAYQGLGTESLAPRSWDETRPWHQGLEMQTINRPTLEPGSSEFIPRPWPWCWDTWTKWTRVQWSWETFICSRGRSTGSQAYCLRKGSEKLIFTTSASRVGFVGTVLRFGISLHSAMLIAAFTVQRGVDSWACC